MWLPSLQSCWKWDGMAERGENPWLVKGLVKGGLGRLRIFRILVETLKWYVKELRINGDFDWRSSQDVLRCLSKGWSTAFYVSSKSQKLTFFEWFQDVNTIFYKSLYFLNVLLSLLLMEQFHGLYSFQPCSQKRLLKKHNCFGNVHASEPPWPTGR